VLEWESDWSAHWDLHFHSPFNHENIMIIKKQKKQVFYSFLLMALFLSCVNEYNPFKDMSNVKIIVENCSFVKKDSVKLFSAETLSISLILKEHIDSFSVIAEKNRLWTDTTVHKNSGLHNTYSFIFSFKDTGNAEISLFLFRDNETNYSEEINRRIYSPLHQEPVIGTFEDSITLSTPPVDDRVKYHWDFGKGTVYWSYTPHLKCLVTQATEDSTGWLWVSDESETHHSPRFSFTFVLRDTTAPRITCLAEHMVGTDTVKTGDSASFTLKFHITDRISDPVKNATINDRPFNYVDARNNIYTTVLENMKQYTPSNPLHVYIYAEDSEISVNSARDTFYVYYDSAIDPSPKTILVINWVNADTIFTSTTLYSLTGKVYNSEHQPIMVNLILNGQTDTSTKIYSNGNGEWGWQVTLQKDTINPIIITARDTNGIIQAQENITIYHDSHLIDTEKPLIILVTVENMDPLTFITDKIKPVITVTTYDKNSPIKEVVIGKDTIRDNTGYIWGDTITLLHGKNSIKIICTDSADNSKDTVITVYHNTLPFLTAGPDYPYYIIKGTSYSDALKSNDFDNDSVVISIADTTVPGLSLNTLTNNSALLTWQTDSLTAGITTISLLLHDGYQDTLLKWEYEIVDSLEIFLPVQFRTTLADFPKYLVAGVEQLACTLSVVDTTGKKPFQYSVYLQSLDTFLLTQDADSVVEWSPSVKDTGTHQLVITVTDAENTHDTLLPALTVIPENQHNCSLSVVSLNPAVQIDYSTYTLDLTGLTDTVLLLYTIHDEDNPLTEHYHVIKKLGNISESFDPDTTSFTVAVIPKPGKAKDTLTVTVLDNTGVPFSIPLIIIQPPLYRPEDIGDLLNWLDTFDSKKLLNNPGSGRNLIDSISLWINNMQLNNTERKNIERYLSHKYGIQLKK